MALGRFTLRRSSQPPAPVESPSTLQPNKAKPASANDASTVDAEAQNQRRRLLAAKVRVHRRLIDEINLAAFEKMPEKDLRAQIHDLVAQHVVNENIVLNALELAQFVDDILH